MLGHKGQLNISLVLYYNFDLNFGLVVSVTIRKGRGVVEGDCNPNSYILLFKVLFNFVCPSQN